MGKIRRFFEDLGHNHPLLSPRPGPLTEGKTRGNTKRPAPTPKRLKGGPPAPQPKPDYFAPAHAIECEWIEVYVPDPKGFHDGCNIEHHDKVRFWIDQNGNLVIYKGLAESAITYHKYRKYVTSGSQAWR